MRWRAFLSAVALDLERSGPNAVLTEWPLDDTLRAEYCGAMQRKYQRLVWMGANAAGEVVVRSTERRYEGMDERTRREVGQQQFYGSVTAKQWIDQERMYSRWAVQYAQTAGV